MRKTRMVFAPFLAALLVLGGMLGTAVAQVTWDTTTVAVTVNTDVKEVGAATGRTLNLGILGLDRLGNVDIFGEAGGSTIIASVTSVIGAPTGGPTPGFAFPGNFAAETRYVELFQGIGESNITYPADASGTDTIVVRLYERRFPAGIGSDPVTRLIDTATLQIPVAKATPTAGILDIESFTSASTDPAGGGTLYCHTGGGFVCFDIAANNPVTNETVDDRIIGQMTVNQAGGTFTVVAYKVNADRTYTFDGNASGSVTVTLTGNQTATEPLGGNRASSTTTYTATGVMQNGVAEVAVSTGFIKAGQYKVVATLGDLGSVPKKLSDDNQTQDLLNLVPQAAPAKVTLSTNLSVVSNTPAGNVPAAAGVDGVTFDPTFTATLVDSFGNKIVTATSPGAVVKVTDANAKVPDFNVVIAAGANSQPSMQPGNLFTPGLASLTGTIAGSLIAPSDPLNLTVRAGANQLVIGPAAGANLPNVVTPAGTTFVFTPTGIGVDNTTQNGFCEVLAENTALVSTDSVTITNMTAQSNGTRESLPVGVSNQGTLGPLFPPLVGFPYDVVLGQFTKVTTPGNLQTNGFKVEDPSGSYAGLIIYPQTGGLLEFTAGSPSLASIKDKANRVVDTITATQVGAGFEVRINGARVSMTDAYGNSNPQGTLAITTTKGVVAGIIDPVGDAADTITISYPAGTTGEDTPTLKFSQPGITSPALKIVFPTVATLDSFETFPAGPVDTPIQLGINAVTPLTVFPRTETGVTVAQADGYFVDYDTVGLAVFDATGTPIPSGSNVLNFTTTGSAPGKSKGRFVMQVFAKTTPDNYVLTVRSLDGTITQDVHFTVSEVVLPLATSKTNVVIDRGSTEDLTISGGFAPYAAVSANPAIVTAAVSGATLTLTGVAVGGPVDVAVTDGRGGTVTVSVTVQPPGAKTVGGETGVKTESVSVTQPLTLQLNITDNGTNPPAGVVQEWLVFGAIVNGVATDFFFFTDSGAVVALAAATDPAAVEYTFDHVSPVQTVTTGFVPGTLGLRAGDTFFYFYAWSPTTVTNFGNAPDLVFDNVVLLNVE